MKTRVGCETGGHLGGLGGWFRVIIALLLTSICTKNWQADASGHAPSSSILYRTLTFDSVYCPIVSDLYSTKYDRFADEKARVDSWVRAGNGTIFFVRKSPVSPGILRFSGEDNPDLRLRRVAVGVFDSPYHE